MKKLIIALLLCGFEAGAQNRVDLSLIEGVTRSSFILDYTIGSGSVEPNIGYAGGMGVGINFNKKIGVVSGLMYEKKGAKFVYGPSYDKRVISYLSVPLQFGLTLFEKNQLLIRAGGVAGFILKENYTIANDGDVPINGTVVNYSAVEYGVLGTVGYCHRFTQNWAASLSANINYGFTEIGPGRKSISYGLLLGITRSFGKEL